MEPSYQDIYLSYNEEQRPIHITVLDPRQEVTEDPGPIPTASLYVADLDVSVTEDQFHHLFAKFGRVLSVKVCRDYFSKISRGYGYVNYASLLDAKNAIWKLNQKVINGKAVRVMLSNRDPIFRNVGARVYFKNLCRALNNKDVDRLFSLISTVMVPTLAVDNRGVSKGHGFVQFGNVDAAEKAISFFQYLTVSGKEVHVGPYVCKEERANYKFRNCPTLYVDNMSEIISDKDVKSAFSEFGQVLHMDIKRNFEKDCLGHGIIVMEDFDDAVSAIKGLHGKLASTIKGLIPKHHWDPWYVGWARSMFEGKKSVSSDSEEETDTVHKKLKGANLYVKNLASSITDEKLEELFSKFGPVTSCRIVLDSEGQSRGFGFVAFATPEDATTAMNALNGKVVEQKPLHVAVFQRKEERKAALQSHFAQQVYFGRGSSPQISAVGHQLSPGSCGFQHQLSPCPSPPNPAVGRPLGPAAAAEHIFQPQSSPGSSPPDNAAQHGFQPQFAPISPTLGHVAGHGLQHQFERVPVAAVPRSQPIWHPPYYVMPHQFQGQGYQMGGGTSDAYGYGLNRVRKWSVPVA